MLTRYIGISPHCLDHATIPLLPLKFYNLSKAKVTTWTDWEMPCHRNLRRMLPRDVLNTNNPFLCFSSYITEEQLDPTSKSFDEVENYWYWRNLQGFSVEFWKEQWRVCFSSHVSLKRFSENTLPRIPWRPLCQQHYQQVATTLWLLVSSFPCSCSVENFYHRVDPSSWRPSLWSLVVSGSPVGYTLGQSIVSFQQLDKPIFFLCH